MFLVTLHARLVAFFKRIFDAFGPYPSPSELRAAQQGRTLEEWRR